MIGQPWVVLRLNHVAKFTLFFMKDICNHDHPYRSVTEEIQKMGYEIDCGNYMHHHEKIGILDPAKSVVKDPEIFYFYGIRHPRILGKTRMMHVGDLWLENEARKAKLDSEWILEVYGKENVERMKELRNNMAELYGINVKMKLVSRKFLYESFSSDLPPLMG